MPIYMDVHEGLDGATQAQVDAAHQVEEATQAEYGVNILSYWFSESEGKAFCMGSAPSSEALMESHQGSHGLLPSNVIEIDPPTLAQFLGDTTSDSHERATVNGNLDTGLRIIMFTDIKGSTDVSVEHGDLAAVDLVNRHDAVVRDALKRFSGREIKHTGDGILAIFVSVTKAVEATIAIQEACAQAVATPNLAIKIGLSAGEPVSQNKDLYGAAVNLAARICDHASGDQTLASGTVRNLSIGKNHRFVEKGSIELKGFPDPVPLFEIAPDDAS
jgi:class 3 adenylate cyclase